MPELKPAPRETVKALERLIIKGIESYLAGLNDDTKKVEGKGKLKVEFDIDYNQSSAVTRRENSSKVLNILKAKKKIREK